MFHGAVKGAGAQSLISQSYGGRRGLAISNRQTFRGRMALTDTALEIYSSGELLALTSLAYITSPAALPVDRADSATV